MDVRVSQSKIDVSKQNDSVVTVSWDAVPDASIYRVYASADRTIANGRLYVLTDGTSIDMVPKQALYGGVSWSSHLLSGGDHVYVGIESMDSENVSMQAITWVDIPYEDVKGTLPVNVFVIGASGERNRVRARGEIVELNYRGEVNGSYRISRYTLSRDDGFEFSWDAPQSSTVGTKTVRMSDPGVRGTENVYRTYRLTAVDAMGVDVPGEVSFEVEYYGGVIGVYGKDSYGGGSGRYGMLGNDDRWHEGLCWVHDGAKWLKSRSVYVYTSAGWKRM